MIKCDYIVIGSAVERKRSKHQSAVMAKIGKFPLFLETTKMCTYSVFILFCNVKNLIDNHVKLRAKLKYGHFIRTLQV